MKFVSDRLCLGEEKLVQTGTFTNERNVFQMNTLTLELDETTVY